MLAIDSHHAGCAGTAAGTGDIGLAEIVTVAWCSAEVNAAPVEVFLNA